jgi:hypothetical protein
LGSFAPVLTARGFDIDYVEAAEGLHDVDGSTPALLIVLGGPIGAYEDGRLSSGERVAPPRPVLLALRLTDPGQPLQRGLNLLATPTKAQADRSLTSCQRNRFNL